MHIRAVVATVSLSITVAIFGIQLTGYLWPALPAAITLGALVAAVMAYRYETSLVWVLAACVLLAAHTVIALLYPPTLSGIDPDTYAMWATQIIRTGNIASADIYMYTQLPIYLTFITSVSHIAGIPAHISVVTIPLALSIVVPITAAWTASKVTGYPLTAWPPVIAALGTSIVTMTIRAGYQPIPMTFGYLLLLLALMLTIDYHQRRKTTVFVLLLVFVTTIMLTHKFLLVPLLVVFIVFELPMASTDKSWPIALPILGILALGVQWAFFTRFGVSAIFKLGQVLNVVGTDPLIEVGTAAAHPVIGGTLGIIARRGHGIVLLPLAALSWIIVISVAIRTRSSDQTLVAGAIAAIASFLPFSIMFPSAIQYTRTIAIAEPLLIGLVVAGGVLVTRRFGHSTLPILGSLAFIIIVAQAGSAPVSADHPANYRAYLTQNEAAAKAWGLYYGSTNISTDPFYSHERPSPAAYVTSSGELRDRYTTMYQPILEPFTNRSLLTACPTSILYRSIDVYRSRGAYVLDWDPEQTLDVAYSRIYDAGEAQQYTKPICS